MSQESLEKALNDLKAAKIVAKGKVVNIVKFVQNKFNVLKCFLVQKR